MSDRTIDFNEVMRNAAAEGHIELVKLCKEFGATHFNLAMVRAAGEGTSKMVVQFSERDAASAVIYVEAVPCN